MKFICVTCKREWISDADRAGKPYECPLCEKERLRKHFEEQKKRPSGTANTKKAKNKKYH